MKPIQFIKFISAVAVIAAATSDSVFAQLSQPFTQGNIVVERVGSGSSSLNSSNNSIFFDELIPTGTGQTPVQSIAIPNSGASAMVEGNGGSQGGMTLSANGQLLCFPGGVTNLNNTISLSSATAAAVPRGIGTLNGNGIYTQAIKSTLAFGGGTIRGAATDGNNNFWGSGTASGVGGIYYLGTASATNDVYSANLRCCGIFNGDLWYSSGSGTPGIGLWQFSGTPTTAVGNTATLRFTTTSSPYNFSVSPDGNTIFYTDDSSGIHKLTKSGGVWSESYVLFGKGCYGLMVDWTTAPATVYATTGSGSANNSLIKISDTGASASATTNATAGANKMFRNLSFAPTNVVATAATLTGVNPASQTVGVGGTATITLSGNTGYPIASNNWYKVTAGPTTNFYVSTSGAVLTIANGQTSDSASYFAVLTNASGSVTSTVVSVTFLDAPPTITGITPAAYTNAVGSPASFTVTASGTTPFSYYWYKEIPGTSTNLIPTATTATLSFAATVTNDTASYQVVVSNAIAPYVATSSVVTLKVTNLPPSSVGVSPASITTNAGFNVSFTATNAGSPPFSYLWYKETLTTTNLIVGATNATLVLSSVLGGDAANYQVVVSNVTTLTATSSVVSLTVTDDPHISTQPASAYGLLFGTVQFHVGVIATSPTYQWWFADSAGTPIAPVSNGSLPSGSTASGVTSDTLTIANLQLTDPTNFVVVVNGTYGGPLTSSKASLLSVGNSATLAFWDFNGSEATNYIVNPNCVTYPSPYAGVGFATAVGSAFFPGGTLPFNSASFSPFSANAGTFDPNDGLGFTSHLPPASMGTSLYPTNGNPALNKTAGVQFNVSTVGAKNVSLSYESRGTGTASKYERLQYTTDGTTWIDYPTSSTWPSTTVGWYPFSYDFSGFAGVANNPSFGVRVVTEYESTATYGVGTNANFVGIANTYGTGGTLTYDLVTFSGTAITNANVPPILSVSFATTNMLDYVPTNISFTVTAGTTPADSLNYSAVSLNPSSFNPSFSFSGSGANRTLTITPNSIAASVAAAPIKITATDANGDVAVTWFDVMVGTVNLPPTNSLTQLAQTNTLANTALAMPFSVGDDRSAVGSLTYAVSSGNNTVLPVANISVSNQGTASPILNILPGTNQLGVGTVSVTVSDNDLEAPKSTTATIPIMVRPNTNVVAIDYFNYDSSGALDAVSSGFWQRLSGNVGQMQVSGGVVTVDTLNNTENLVTPLLGAPYSTNSGAVLYASFMVNMANPVNMPRNNGTYFACFQNGTTVSQNSSATSFIEGCVVAATNGAASGNYRLGIGNVNGANATNSAMVNQDLLPNSNYVVVVKLVVSTGIATLWVNPTDQSSPSVTDTHTPPKYDVATFELRESGANAGAVTVSRLKVGTTFDAVFPSLNIQSGANKVVLNWSDPTLGIQSTTNLMNPFADVSGATPPYTNSTSTTNTLFFRFKP